MHGIPGALPGTHRDGRLERRGVRVAELTYRDAVSAAIAQEMERDPSVYFIGEDVAAAGGRVQGDHRPVRSVRPGAGPRHPDLGGGHHRRRHGRRHDGLRPIVEIMFSDFLATCWDMVANQIAKTRYMTNGQISLPLVIRTANGGGSRFGAQHSQSLENWAMAVPGLKVVAPSTPADAKGLLAAAIRDPDPVVVFEHKSLYATKGEVPDGEHVEPWEGSRAASGSRPDHRHLAAMVPRSLEAAEQLAGEGIDAEVIDVRSLVPLDTRHRSCVRSRRRDGSSTVEENPRLCGWGAEIVSIAAEECFDDLDGPIVRITTPHIPSLPPTDWRMRRSFGRSDRGDRVPEDGLRRLRQMTQPRLRDVAEAAGVHVATASRALNERTVSMVSPQTVERVRAAARTLGYRPNHMARGLKTRRSFTVGMLIPDITNPFFPPMVRGAEDGLAGAGYTLVFADTDNDEEEADAEGVLLERQVDGLFLGTVRRRGPLVDELRGPASLFVLVNRTIDRGGVAAVIPDDEAGMTLVVDRLDELRTSRDRTRGRALSQTSSGAGGRPRGFLAAVGAHG